MKCPACGNELREKKAGEITVDVCEGGCGGIWFDQFEFRKVDEPHESAGESLLESGRRKDVYIDRSAKRKCPRCDSVVMMRHFFCTKKEIEVDECPGCGGFWLDAGELGEIRSQYDNEEDRDKAAKEYFSELFGVHLTSMKAESREKLKKARSIASMFRFICPSAYIPGKQDWGAF